MIAANINKEWVSKVTFKEFCKDVNISRLSYSEQCELWQIVTGKEPEIEKLETKKPKVKEGAN